MIFVVDFGSQTAHLIARRVKELGSPTRIVTPSSAFKIIQKEKPQGIIFSGGPQSVYEKNSPTIDPEIFNLGIAIMGICYGFQTVVKLLGGKVVSGRKEYGPTILKLKIKNEKLKITQKLPKEFTVWMSHGDEIVSLPKGFEVIGSTEHVPYAFVQAEKEKIFGLLFHPEVEHTEYGLVLLRNFVEIAAISPRRSPFGHLRGDRYGLLGGEKVEEIINDIKKTVGDAYVIGAVSGGVDSTVAGTLVAKAIGDRFIPIFVDNGMMRQGTAEEVKKIFSKHHIKPIVVDAVGKTLLLLKKITDSEKKRKVIGNIYIEFFEQEMEKLINLGKNVKFLMQGTIYSDVIESNGTKYSSKIKSHHNVGGLPKNMKLKLLEPIREFYKDEVRKIGQELGLSPEFVWKQPFPGPGYAVRIRGEVTGERLAKEKQADLIILEELDKAKLLSSVFLSFPVMTGASSTAVKGDSRFFGEVIAVRVVTSRDVMTATWTRLPFDVLQKISSRIVNEVNGISRVVYDISTKPPATMEWE